MEISKNTFQNKFQFNFGVRVGDLKKIFLLFWSLKFKEKYFLSKKIVCQLFNCQSISKYFCHTTNLEDGWRASHQCMQTRMVDVGNNDHNIIDTDSHTEQARNQSIIITSIVNNKVLPQSFASFISNPRQFLEMEHQNIQRCGEETDLLVLMIYCKNTSRTSCVAV